MASFQAKIANQFIRLLGLKSFYDNPEKVPAKIAKLRAKGPDMPKKSFAKKYKLTEISGREYPVYKIEPKTIDESAPQKCVLYFHGGGYVLDVAWAHWDFVGRLVDATGHSVILPLYPLAPEHKCAALIPEMVSLYCDIEQKYGANNIVLMGDSAGGGLSLSVAHALRDQNLPAPSKLVLHSPWLDATATHPDQPKQEKKDNMIAVKALKGFGQMYAGDLALDDPRVSPLFGDHKNLPPIQVFTGTAETLYPDSTRFRDQMDALGTPISYHEYADMFHVWMLLPIPEGKQVIGDIVDFLG